MSTGSSNCASRRAPTEIRRSSRPPSASSAARPRFDDSSTPSSGRCVRQPRSTIARSGRRRTRRDSRGSRRGRAPAVRARARRGSTNASARGGPSSACASRASASHAIRHRESHVAGFVRVALAPADLAGQAAAAHVVGPAQMRGRDLRQILAVHEEDASWAVRQHIGSGSGGSATRSRSRSAEAQRERPINRTHRYTRRVRIAIGSDHAGFPLKQHLIGVLKELGPRRRRPRDRLRGAGRLPDLLRGRRRARSCRRRRRDGHRARRQRPGRADLGQQGPRRPRRALQRPLHRPHGPRAQQRQRACRSAPASWPPSSPTRSRRSS